MRVQIIIDVPDTWAAEEDVTGLTEVAYEEISDAVSEIDSADIIDIKAA